MATATQTEQFVELTNGQTRYLEAGTGDNYFILLHGMGFTQGAQSFRGILDDLAERYHCYALDMLGFGKGTREVLDGLTFDLIVDTVREFMDVKGIEKAHLLGHSAGGWMGALFGYESPDRVKKLVMLAAAGLNASNPTVGNAPPMPTLESLEEQARRMFRDPTTIDEALVKARAQEALEIAQVPGALTSLEPLQHQMATQEIRKRYLLHRRLPFIKVPTLVVWGDGDTMDPYPTWNEEYDRLKGDMTKSSKPWTIPGARYVKMPTGHNVHGEMPKETVELLFDFLGE